MKRESSPLSGRLSAALVCGLFLFAPAGMTLAQEKPGEAEPAIPKGQLLPKDLPDSIGDKNKLLHDLYDQLSRTAGADEAKIVTGAIERLWLRSGSDTIDLLMVRTAKMMQDQEHDIALDLLDSIIELAPEYPEAWARRAAVLFAKKDFRQSLESLRHALALDPSHYKAIEGLGLIMQELGDKEAALKAFRRVLKIHPHLDDAVQAVKELSREVEGQGI